MSGKMQAQGLAVCLSLKDWKKLPTEEREEINYQLLCLLVAEMSRNKVGDRIMTFAGSFLANLIILIPAIIYAVEKIGGR